MGGRRSGGSWRYKVIKRHKRRAMKFRDEAKTIEEKIAWSAVIQWFDDILENKCLNDKDSISLPYEDVKDFAESMVKTTALASEEHTCYFCGDKEETVLVPICKSCLDSFNEYFSELIKEGV